MNIKSIKKAFLYIKITSFMFLMYNMAYAMEKKPIKQTPLLTYNQCAKAMYSKTLTDEQLTVFAQHLLEQRIEYLKNELKKTEETNNETTINKIPLYIRLLPDIRAEEMLESCTITEKIIGTKEQCSLTGCTKKLKNGACSIVMRFNHPTLFFKTLQHELTHVEQKINARAINKVAGIKTCSLSNNDAQRIYNEYKSNTNFRKDKKYIISTFSNEDEADDRAFRFYHNPYLLNEIFKKNSRKVSTNTEKIVKGYFTPEEKLKVSQKYSEDYYTKYPEKLFEDLLQAALWQSKTYFKSNKIPSLFYTNQKFANLLGMYIIIKKTYKNFISTQEKRVMFRKKI